MTDSKISVNDQLVALEPTIRRIVRGTMHRHAQVRALGFDEAYSLALEAAWKALPLHDPARSSLNTWLSLRIGYRLREMGSRLLERYRKRQEIPLTDLTENPEPAQERASMQAWTEQKAAQAAQEALEDAQDSLERGRESLDADELELYEALYVRKESLATVAERLDVSPRSIGRYAAEVRQKLKQAA